MYIDQKIPDGERNGERDYYKPLASLARIRAYLSSIVKVEFETGPVKGNVFRAQEHKRPPIVILIDSGHTKEIVQHFIVSILVMIHELQKNLRLITFNGEYKEHESSFIKFKESDYFYKEKRNVHESLSYILLEFVFRIAG